MRRVWACDACGREADSDVESCPDCGGRVEEVDRMLVATMDLLEALVAPKETE